MDAYDAVPYGSRPFPEAHPDRLCVVARLFGRTAADPATARILDLGCGEGGHLVPIAARLPGTRCVGLDRSAPALARAREVSARAGASVEWVEADLLDADAVLPPGEYDYVVAHGVYSWVPAEVRDALFATIARRLAPDGVAYVSWNARPGWGFRGMVAEMLRFHARGFEAPERRVAQARAMLGFLADAVPETDPYGAWLRREARLVAGMPDAWVFHDLLAEVNEPVLLTELVAHAERHGLAYLGDADLPSMLPDRLPARVRSVLEGVGEDLVRTEQYLDFVVCRNFRRSLLCRPGPVDRELSWTRLQGLAVRSMVALDEEASTPASATFRSRAGDALSLTTSVGLVRAALRAASSASPGAVAVEELVWRARAEAGTSDERADTELVLRNLLACFVRGVVELYPRPIRAVAAGERPEVDAVCRALAPGAEAVANLLHEGVRIDGLDRSLMPACDGTRTLAELLDAVAPEGDPMRDRIAAILPDRLREYAAAGLLIG